MWVGQLGSSATEAKVGGMRGRVTVVKKVGNGGSLLHVKVRTSGTTEVGMGQRGRIGRESKGRAGTRDVEDTATGAGVEIETGPEKLIGIGIGIGIIIETTTGIATGIETGTGTEIPTRTKIGTVVGTGTETGIGTETTVAVDPGSSVKNMTKMMSSTSNTVCAVVRITVGTRGMEGRGTGTGGVGMGILRKGGAVEVLRRVRSRKRISRREQGRKHQLWGWTPRPQLHMVSSGGAICACNMGATDDTILLFPTRMLSFMMVYYI